MRVTVLGSGTSTGIPIVGCNCKVCCSNDSRDKRLRSSIMIETKGKKILIDAGPDFRQQMLVNKFSDLDAVFITHSHMDHIGGFDDLRAINYSLKKKVKVFAAKRDQDVIKQVYSYAFKEDKYPGVPDVELFELTEISKVFPEINVEVVPVMHYKMEVYAFRFDKFAYVTDVKTILDESMSKLQNLDLLILDCLRKTPHISHMNMEESLALVEKLQPKHTYFTHLSHQMGLHEEVEKELPKNISLAYDGLVLGELKRK